MAETHNLDSMPLAPSDDDDTVIDTGLTETQGRLSMEMTNINGNNDIKYPKLSKNMDPSDPSAPSDSTHGPAIDDDKQNDKRISSSNDSRPTVVVPIQNTLAIQESILHDISSLVSCCDFERNLKTAYYIWGFLGFLGFHHLYLRRYSHYLWCLLYLWILGQILYSPDAVLVLIVIYVLIWLIDGFRIKSMVKIANMPYDERYYEWSLYDIYLMWLPPYGIFGMHHFYMRNYWRGLSYLFSFGLCGFGWAWDFILIIGYYHNKIVQSLKKPKEINVNLKIYDKNPYWSSKYEPKRSICTLIMTWFPFGGWIGLHHFYSGDIALGVCYFFTCGGWFIGWIIDLCRLKYLQNRYNKNICQQIEKWQMEVNNNGNINGNNGIINGNKVELQIENKDNIDISNASITRTHTRSEGHIKTIMGTVNSYSSDNLINQNKVNNNMNEFRVKRPKFKKTILDSYITWLSALGFLGIHHLYLHNWLIFLGHILNLGGFGIMWIADCFLLPWFMEYSNQRLGFLTSKKLKMMNYNTVDITDVNNVSSGVIIPSLDDQVVTTGNINDDDDNNNIHDEDEIKTDTIGGDVVRSDLSSMETDNKRIFADSQKQKILAMEKKIEFQRALYITYLWWMGPMGWIGVYYIYLGKYKQFIYRFFTLNFLFIGWLIDFCRIWSLVETKMDENEKNEQSHSLIQNQK